MLDLSHCGITNPYAEALADALRAAPVVMSLDLRGNAIGFVGAMALYRTLKWQRKQAALMTTVDDCAGRHETPVCFSADAAYIHFQPLLVLFVFYVALLESRCAVCKWLTSQ